MPQPRDQVTAFTAAKDGDGQAFFVPGWGDGEWADLFSYATEIALPSGATLMQHGEAGRTLYFVAAGGVEVALVYGDQTLGAVRRVGPGSVVGEVAFFDGLPRTAKVWAVQDTRLLRLNFEDYRRFAAANHERSSDLVFALGRLVAIRLRDILTSTRA